MSFDDPVRDDPPEGSGRLIFLGVLLYPLIVWGLATRGGMGVVDAGFLALLVELLPVLAVAQVPLVDPSEVDRMGIYLASAVTISLLGSVALLLGGLGMGLEAMGVVVLESPAEAAAWAAGAVAATLLLGLGFVSARRSLGWPESRLLRKLMPETGTERAGFAGLSAAAGIGEELAYRGYAIPLMAPVLGGDWQAAFFTSAAFALLHAYQGALGILRTGLVGVVFAATFLVTDSLWPAVVAHVTVDLLMGLVLAKHFLD